MIVLCYICVCFCICIAAFDCVVSRVVWMFVFAICVGFYEFCFECGVFRLVFVMLDFLDCFVMCCIVDYVFNVYNSRCLYLSLFVLYTIIRFGYLTFVLRGCLMVVLFTLFEDYGLIVYFLTLCLGINCLWGLFICWCYYF